MKDSEASSDSYHPNTLCLFAQLLVLDENIQKTGIGENLFVK